MNSVQLHLALTHVPVILSLVGLVMLIIAIAIKNPTLTKTSYIIIVVSGISAIPVFLTGEGAEEAVEKFPGVAEAIIEQHEDIAKISLISIAISGVVSLMAVFFSQSKKTGDIFKVAVLFLALVSGWLMIQTAHLGGQIRHTEAKNTSSMLPVENQPAETEQGKPSEADDD